MVGPDEVHAPRVEVLVHDGLLGEPRDQLVAAGGKGLAKVLGNLRDKMFSYSVVMFELLLSPITKGMLYYLELALHLDLRGRAGRLCGGEHLDHVVVRSDLVGSVGLQKPNASNITPALSY